MKFWFIGDSMVFVIVPFFRNEKYIKECVESLNNQSVDVFPIFVNDGSPDKSRDIIIENIKTNNYHLIDSEWGGISHARNLALDFIFEQGFNLEDSYICFLDSDDELDNFFVEKYVLMMQKFNSDIVCGGTTSTREFKDSTQEDNFNAHDALINLINNQIRSYACVKMYKANLWQNVRFPNEIRAFEDVATVYKVFVKSNNVTKSNSRLYFYRPNPESIIRSNITNDKMLNMMDAYIIRDRELKTILNHKESYNDVIALSEAAVKKAVLDGIWNINFKKISATEKIILCDSINYYQSLARKKDKTKFKETIKRIKLFLIRFLVKR